MLDSILIDEEFLQNKDLLIQVYENEKDQEGAVDKYIEIRKKQILL